jgi:hypothetical protein
MQFHVQHPAPLLEDSPSLARSPIGRLSSKNMMDDTHLRICIPVTAELPTNSTGLGGASGNVSANIFVSCGVIAFIMIRYDMI